MNGGMIMKNFLATILPSIVLLAFIWIDSMFPESKYIILGIYLLFPIIFIIQGIIYSNSKESMIVGFTLSAAAVILPISIWYNLGNIVTPVIIYLLLGMLSFYLFRKIKYKSV
ncbi:hypothetical protein [Gottfriedia acidiceleris]|uniref:hypothetical protein n=1 Tax=Gottfriedia acidiceleris TaxID=371036 RepID=UPI000B45225D|nr:hypothetical protein [Gottfriedia acidiceleris]